MLRPSEITREAYSAVQRWVDGFNSGDVEAIVASYASNALVFGTLSPLLASSPDELRAYFEASSAAKLRVRMGKPSAAALSDHAVTFAGFYEFSRPCEGETVIIPARFTFVVIRSQDVWQIVHHHSSTRPNPAQ